MSLDPVDHMHCVVTAQQDVVTSKGHCMVCFSVDHLKGVWWETWMAEGGVVGDLDEWRGVVGDLDEWRGCGGRPG